MLLQVLRRFFKKNVEAGYHDDEQCEEYCQIHKDTWGEKISCKFKESRYMGYMQFDIRNLLRKIEVIADSVDSNLTSNREITLEPAQTEDSEAGQFENHDNVDEDIVPQLLACIESLKDQNSALEKSLEKLKTEVSSRQLELKDVAVQTEETEEKSILSKLKKLKKNVFYQN